MSHLYRKFPIQKSILIVKVSLLVFLYLRKVGYRLILYKIMHCTCSNKMLPIKTFTDYYIHFKIIYLLIATIDGFSRQDDPPPKKIRSA